MIQVKRLSTAVLVLLFGSLALGQTGTSRITGRVFDSKQAAVAGASVTITNEATGVSQTQTHRPPSAT